MERMHVNAVAVAHSDMTRQRRLPLARVQLSRQGVEVSRLVEQERGDVGRAALALGGSRQAGEVSV